MFCGVVKINLVIGHSRKYFHLASETYEKSESVGQADICSEMNLQPIFVYFYR